jgi:outer membrane protein assembly factor BamB
VRWDLSLSPGAAGDLQLTQHLLLVAEESLVGVDPESGQTRWQSRPHKPSSAGVARHGRIIVASADAAHLLDQGTGLVLWSSRLPENAGAATGAPPVFTADHRIVLATASALIVLSELDGSLLAMHPITSPPVDPIMLLDDKLVGLRQADGQFTLFDLDQMQVVHEVANTGVPALADESAVYVMGRRGWQRIALDGMRSTGWLRWEEDEWGTLVAPPVASARSIVFVTDQGIVVAHGRSAR